MGNKEIITDGAVCAHAAENLGVISQGKKLLPINGKFLWHISEDSITSDMDKYKVIFAFEQCFKKWQPYLSPIIIEATGDKNQAQIIIKFKSNGDKDLPFPFGNGVLAYAYAPDGTSLGLNADMFFNDAFNWADIHKASHIYLFKVAVHEAGHVFNLGHSRDKADILYPIYQPNGDVIITRDTQNAIYSLYKEFGVKNPNSPTPTPTPNPTPNPTPTPTPNPTPDPTLSLKRLFNLKSEVGRLSLRQLLLLNSLLNAGVSARDRFNIRINKIYEAIHK